jgi:ribose transport system permease protein
MDDLRQAGMIWVALIGLFILCAVFESSTLKGSALLSMLPFAAILAIAAVGQCLVIQQGGIDFSVVGSITLSAAIVTGHAAGQNGKLFSAIVMALVAVLIAGLINGIAITQLRITPIIATLATNALLLGAVQTYTNGIPKAAADNLSSFAIDKTLGIPHTVYIAAIVVIVASVVLGKTVVGRRFVAIGANPEGARAAGLRVSRYVIGTYMLAALCYGVAGIVLAGYVKTPGTTLGNPYLLSTITAVVVGGTALGGGRGRIVGTAVAAVFLSQLEAFIAATGAPASVSLLVQSAAIAIAVGFSNTETATAIRALLGRLIPRSRTVTAPGDA